MECDNNCEVYWSQVTRILIPEVSCLHWKLMEIHTQLQAEARQNTDAIIFPSRFTEPLLWLIHPCSGSLQLTQVPCLVWPCTHTGLETLGTSLPSFKAWYQHWVFPSHLRLKSNQSNLSLCFAEVRSCPQPLLFLPSCTILLVFQATDIETVLE